MRIAAPEFGPGPLIAVRMAAAVLVPLWPGIPADELSRLVDRFHKGRYSRGSGLGLAIAQTGRRAGGEIRVESRVGEGATVKVTLPR
jgi:K+-sensing histidine kinase KdpD